MQKGKITLQFYDYYKGLEVINDVNFTWREIDTISWIMSGKTGKTAALFLSISPKTLETHTRNIMRKIECNSREGIINFIEKSGKAELVRKLYKTLLIQGEFEKCLEQILFLIKEDNIACFFHIFTNTNQEIFQRLKKDLESVNIKVNNISKKSLSDRFLEEKVNRYDLYLVGKDEAVGSYQNLSQNIQKPIFVFFNEGIPADTKADSSKNVYLSFKTENYYFSFLELLKTILLNKNLETIIEEFKNQYESLVKNFSDDNFLSFAPQEENLESVPQVFSNSFGNFLRKHLRVLIFSCFLCLIFSVFLLLETQTSKTIYSGLTIPHDSVFLKRPEIIKSTEEKLSGSQEIQTVALIGIGGVGKTTIARQYAHQQNADVIWEINAEKESSLFDSFESLAYALAKTDEDKKILKELQEINNYKERIEKILSFTKGRLKAYRQWFLIYDNVENFSDIQKYFPTDSKVWGNGRIIITTKDSNIASNSYVNHILLVGELSEKEKLNLFMNVMTHGSSYPLLSAQKQHVHGFLTKLPPFPLDISTAAYYLKATNIYYDEYIERLHKHDVNFEDTQENIIKESTEYTKTRQKIILLTVEKLININKDFKDLLLFIALLDSQEIPRDLLEKFKSNFIVDSFIYNLKKYSLITNESSMRSILCFSIHRSMQAISLACLSNILNSNEKNQIIQNISYSLKKYTNDVISTEDFSKFKLVINHCATFLNQKIILDETIKKEIESELGCIYFYLGDYKKAIEILDESLSDLNKHKSTNYNQIARILSYLGMIYEEQGDYKKAKDLLEESLAIYRKHLPENHVGIARTLSYLGLAHKDLREDRTAKELLEQALSIYRKHLPENHVGIARALSYLGINCREHGDYKKAVELLEESTAIYKKYLPENFTFIAQILSYLGIVYRELGNYKKAIELLEESTAIYKKYLPENHLDVAVNLMYLGSAYRELGNYKKAIELLEESIDIYKKYISEDNIDLADALTYLGENYREVGNYKKAKNLFEDSLRMTKIHLPENHIDIGWILTLLGHIYKQQGDYKKAKDLLEESLMIHRKNLPEGHIDIAWVLAVLGDAYGYLGYYTQANEYFEKSFSVYKKHFEFEENHIKMGWILMYLGDFYKNARQLEKAKESYEASLKIYEKHFGKNHIDTIRLLKNLGQVYLLQGNIQIAEKLIKEALEVFQKNEHSESYMCLESLAEIYMIKSSESHKSQDINQSNIFKRQAVDCLKKALGIIEIYYPEDSPHITRIELNLKKLLLNNTPDLVSK